MANRQDKIEPAHPTILNIGNGVESLQVGSQDSHDHPIEVIDRRGEENKAKNNPAKAGNPAEWTAFSTKQRRTPAGCWGSHSANLVK